MEKYFELVIAFITGVIGPILIIYIKYLLEKRKRKPDMVMDTLRVSELINHKIDEIKEQYDADRVWISQFHNGGNFYPTGKSIAKFSIMYETVKAGTISVQSNFKNIPVNLFSKSINELLNNEVIRITDFEDETVSTFGLKYIAEETGCKSAYLMAIKTLDGKFIGILAIDYTKTKVSLNDEEVNHLTNHASSLGGVLMSYLQQ